jgi:hypothetical protein
MQLQTSTAIVPVFLQVSTEDSMVLSFTSTSAKRLLIISEFQQDRSDMVIVSATEVISTADLFTTFLVVFIPTVSAIADISPALMDTSAEVAFGDRSCSISGSS